MIARSLLLVTALVSAHAAVDCGNGNQCADGQTCLGRLSAPNGTIVGLKYGCSPASLGPKPTVCPAGIYSCPSGDVCVISKNQFLGDDAEVVLDCAPFANATVTSRAKINPSSKSIKAPLKNTICTTLRSYGLSSSCQCTGSGNYGAIADCSYSLYVTTVGIKFTVLPCGMPSQVGIAIYGAGVTAWSISAKSGSTIANYPIPGASIGLPSPFPSAGLYLSFSVAGNPSKITMSGKLDACASVPIFGTKCGSYFGVPGLPATLISISGSFSSVCDTSSDDDNAPAPVSRRRRSTPVIDDDDGSSGGSYYANPYVYYCRSDEVEVKGQDWISGAFCSPWCYNSGGCPNAYGATAYGECLISYTSGDESCLLICSEDGKTQDYTCPMGAECQASDGYGVCTYLNSYDGITKSGKPTPSGLKLLPFGPSARRNQTRTRA